jgi:hypothetical protein
MNDVRLRTIFAALCAAAACLSLGSTPNAAPTSPIIAHFAAKAPYDGDSGSPARIDIMIERWSTDKELENLHGALTKNGTDGLLPVLQSMRPRVGVVLVPGIQASGARVRLRRPFNVYFARENKTSKGTQVILGVDHYLAFGQRTADWSEDFEFSLVDIRLGPDGSGVGQIARAKNVTYNKEAKTIEVANFSKVPPQLTEVKADKAGAAARTAGAKQ